MFERVSKSKKNDDNDKDSSVFSDSGIESALQCHREEKAFVGADRAERQTRRATISRWKSLTYSQKNSELYLVGRLAPNFAVACRILYEIRKRCPLFVPHTFFDFASGLGTYTW